MENSHPSGHAIKRQASSAPKKPPLGGNLFDTLSAWLENPVLAYASWLNGKVHLRESTKRVYLSMFGRFAQYLSQRNLNLATASTDETFLKEFLDSTNPNLPESHPNRKNTGRQRKQYLRLLERVYAHLSTLGLGIESNPARKEKRDQEAFKDNPTRFLTREETRAVIRILQSRLAELSKAQERKEKWMDYRDLALVGVIIGGGLKVSHIGTLTLNCIDRRDAWIDLSKPGHAHRARLLSFAMPLLEGWLTVQTLLHDDPLPPTHKVFEADRTVGFGRNCKKATMAASSVHRRVSMILRAAGVSGDRASPQTLRNTYAALLIEGGASDENLVDYLGLKASITAVRLRAAYHKSRAGQLSLDAVANAMTDGSKQSDF